MHGAAILVKETRLALGVIERRRSEIGKGVDAHAVSTTTTPPGSIH